MPGRSDGTREERYRHMEGNASSRFPEILIQDMRFLMAG